MLVRSYRTIVRKRSVLDMGNHARIARALGSAYVPARYSWGYASVSPPISIPADPVTTTIHNVTNQGEFDAAITNGAVGRLINVGPGSYTMTALNSGTTSDLDIVLSNAATITSGMALGGFGDPAAVVRRIRVTGGIIASGFLTNSNTTDIMFDNVRFNGMTEVQATNGKPQRIAYTNCTLRNASGQVWCMLATLENFIAAACNFDASYNPGENTAVRMAARKAIFARNRLLAAGGHRTIRLHATASEDSDLVLFTGEQWENTADNHWFDPSYGQGYSTGLTRIELHALRSYINGAGIRANAIDTHVPINDFTIANSEFYHPFAGSGGSSSAGLISAGDAPTGATYSGNTVAPWQAPPAFTRGANH
jgi:hypothetical protein